MQPKLNFVNTDSIGSLNNISALDTASLPRHRWYYFKEAFSPSLVSRAIEDSQCTKDDLIIDPFNGSGTVALTSALEGCNAVGFEVNPFLAFVSRTKLQHCTPATVDNNLSEIITGVKHGIPSYLETFSTFSKAGGANKWLFNQEVLRAFEGGWSATIGKPSSVRSILQLCLIGAAMDVSNAVKDGKCLRYRKDWRERNFKATDFINVFKHRINIIRQDLKECPLKTSNANICLTDFRSVTRSALPNKKFKLCVMSPPYLNSFDYTDVYRPELFLGKFVKSHDDLKALRFKTLRSHVQVNWASPKETSFGQHFTESFAEIKKKQNTLWNKRIPAMIQAYFEDIKQVLINLKMLAKSNSSIWIVVSTSAYAGVEIPVDLIIADIGCQTGWFLREVSVMRYLRRVSGQQWDELSRQKTQRPYLRESIIILDAKPCRNKKLYTMS